MQETLQKQTHKTKQKNAWKYILSVLIILIYILPIYVLVVMAFKHPTDLGSRLIPPNYFDLSNFTSIIESGKLFRALGNTILIAVGTVAIEVVFGCMAAYAFARNRSRLNSFMQSFCLGIMMIPPLSILVGVYTELVALGGINQQWAVIVIAAHSACRCQFIYTQTLSTPFPSRWMKPRRSTAQVSCVPSGALSCRS